MGAVSTDAFIHGEIQCLPVPSIRPSHGDGMAWNRIARTRTHARTVQKERAGPMAMARVSARLTSVPALGERGRKKGSRVLHLGVSIHRVVQYFLTECENPLLLD